MAKREVTVVINGEEFVSKAAQEAEAGLTGFAGFMDKLKNKLVPVVDVTKLVELAVRGLTAAFTAAKQFVMDAIGAYDAYVSSQVKLAAQSKLTGVSMREMNALVETARSSFGLGTVAAVDIAAAVAKFASQSGKAGDAAKLMASALELGAASGQTAAQVAEGLSSALAGNDEWLNRLGLANPSGLWKDYADANGLAVSKMSDTEKKLAVMTALIDAGSKVTGVYSERMASASGQQERLNNNLDTAKVMFGAAIQPIRILVIQGLTALLNVIGPVVIALGYLASGVTNLIVGPFRLAQSAIGSVVEVAGRLSGNKTLEEWGRKNSQAFVQFTDDVGKWLGVTKPATQAVHEQAKAHQLATVQITASKDATDQHTESTKRLEAAHKPLYAALGMTKGALESLAQSARDQLPPKPAQDFNAAIESIRKGSDEIAANMKRVGTEALTSSETTGDMAREVETFARGALDAAESFGVIDDKAARSLNSAINIASAVGQMAEKGFSFAGAVGVIGGVASIVNTMMAGDAERRRLLRENNAAISKLSKDIGGLKLNVSGDDIEKARTATLGFRANENSVSPNELQADIDRLSGLLSSQGISMGEFERIAKELGVNIRNSKGEITASGLNAAIRALGIVQPGRLGQSFQDQLSFFRESQRIDGASGSGALTGLLDFLRNVGGVTALNGLDASDPKALRSALRNLFVRLNNGEGVQGLGKLTGQQFMDVILSIIGDIDALGTATGVSPTSPDAPISGGGTSSGGGATIPTETVQEVIKAMDTNIAEILTSHTAIHERIAVATEGTLVEVRILNGKMDTLIATTANQAATLDARFAVLQAQSRLTAGVGPEF